MVSSDGPETGRQPRPYESPRRQRSAADTRRRIAAAGGELFAEHGFEGTTVASIAKRAGVAVPTVYATFGSKGAIVGALLTQLEQEADGPNWARRIAEENDPHRKLAAFAQWTTAMFSSSRAAIQAAQGAIGDPAMAKVRSVGDNHRRQGLRPIIAELARSGALSADLDPERALDQAWMLTGVELYLSSTQGCGWSDEEYQSWLADLLQQQLLGQPEESKGTHLVTGSPGPPGNRTPTRARSSS